MKPIIPASESILYIYEKFKKEDYNLSIEEKDLICTILEDSYSSRIWHSSDQQLMEEFNDQGYFN